MGNICTFTAVTDRFSVYFEHSVKTNIISFNGPSKVVHSPIKAHEALPFYLFESQIGIDEMPRWGIFNPLNGVPELTSFENQLPPPEAQGREPHMGNQVKGRP